MPLGIYTSNAFENQAGVQVVPNANVEVRLESTGALAPIYSTRDADSNTEIDQVGYPGTTGFKAGADGYFEFYAEGVADGYRVRVYSDDLSLDKTLRYQPTGTARERDASDYGASIMGAADDAAARVLIGLPETPTDGKIPIGNGADLSVEVPVPMGFSLLNGYLDWTVAGNVLTVAVKNWAGNDPSADDPVFVAFRDPTAATGLPLIRKLIAATSISINNGATLGTANSTPFRIWCVAFDDAGAVRLALINCLAGTAPSFSIYPLGAWPIGSATQETDGSDSAHVFYSDGAAVASKAYAVIGYATWEAGLATAGAWSAGPTRKQLHGPGGPLPGQIVQTRRTFTATEETGTTQLPSDDTTPTNTEGDQYNALDTSITPVSAANMLDIEAAINASNNAAGGFSIGAALFQDAGAAAIACQTETVSQNFFVSLNVCLSKRADQTTSTTFLMRVGANVAGTTTINPATFGGVGYSSMRVNEIMA